MHRFFDGPLDTEGALEFCDCHSGNYGFMVDNDTGKALRMAPLAPKLGTDFISVARALVTPAIRSKLVALKDFSYESPGYGYPEW